MSEQQKLWFHASVKSIVSSHEDYDTSLLEPSQVASKVAPRGTQYHIRRDFHLGDDDWVIFGVASTSNVDLVDDTIDAEEVFSESLEEFVNTGRIFWEHGYKLAGKVEADNPITAPIGVPYLVEIHDNELLVYIVLDKTHPTARMVWDRVNQGDKRFSKGIGLSIGAIPQGKPVMVKDPMTGNYVKKSPKMRLYEISVTGQPINPYTWTEVVKSFIADNLKEEEQMARKSRDSKTVTKAVENEMMEDPMAAAEGGAMEAPMEGGAEDPMAGMGEAGMEGDAMGGDMAMGDEGGMEAGMGAEEGEGMLDMLGGMDEESGLEPAGEGEADDISMDVIMDKLDMLTSQVSQLLEEQTESSDMADVEDAMEESLAPDVEDTPAPDGEESDAGESDEIATFEPDEVTTDEDEDEDKLDAISKSLASQSDRTDLIFEVVKDLPQALKTIGVLRDRVEALEEMIKSGTLKTMKSENNEDEDEDEDDSDVDSDREEYESTTKSLAGGDASKKAVTKGVRSAKHPGYEDRGVSDATRPTAEVADDDAVLKSVMNNEGQLDLLAELVGTWKSLKGNPVYVAGRKEEIYDIANETLGLTRQGFKRAVSLVKNS